MSTHVKATCPLAFIYLNSEQRVGTASRAAIGGGLVQLYITR